ncbi:anthranilate synthase component 1 [Thalassotalea euphylliae]|uniref:Anthranilate synthase component 1 n=1 Tax=Thalassotalea euphylliae TaxID=1655234 RepID=A0A3E0U7C5_9GAMM|nr:anthranilate synthase component 1 [Thalassotalea euphylliae]REL32453.1 anthranilate synthase component 1 [Thalassotalea euphylliae]
MQTTLNATPGAVNTLSGAAEYQPDPLAVYQQLCGIDAGNKPHTVLLESAEIDKKHALKSLLVTDAAVKVTCHGLTVTLEPLSLNGESAIEFVSNELAAYAKVSKQAAHTLIEFSPVDGNLDELTRLKAHNAFDALRVFKQINNTTHHELAVMLAGCFAFDLMAVAEKLPEVDNSPNSCPDYVFYLAETIVVIDHEKRSTELIGNVFSGPEQQKCYFEISRRLSEIKAQLSSVIVAKPLQEKANAEVTEVSVDISDQAFCHTVDALKEHVRAGDIFQVVPSRTFTLPCEQPIVAYKKLKASNPSPYMFFLQDKDFAMFGASPESALKYQTSNNQVELYPIAGTRPRGFNADGSLSLDLDSRIELELRQDQKEMAEHIMLVDLARNDIARVAAPGSRYVAELLKVDRYSHVMHLVSRVCGQLKPELDALHAYQACMNMGTLSGAPKVKATELIRKFEGKRRGSYGGAVGYITGEGEMDTCIVIRSAFVENGLAHVQAGAGVVYDSDPQAEANETRQKAQAVINAIKAAEILVEVEEVGA